MDPVLDDRKWCFVSVSGQEQAATMMQDALASFREVEGLSLIVPEETARAQIREADTYACIALNIHSALDGVGLTAAVAGALANHSIACNMVAAYHHDYAFVPFDKAQQALAILKERQALSTQP